jgi:hypothetical protein
LEGTSGLVIDLDFFGSYSDFVFKFLGRHEEVTEGCQEGIDGGQEGLFLKAREPVIADVFADDGAVFLLHETVVVFLVVAAACEGEGFFGAPDFGGVVDKLRAIIAVKLGDGQESAERALKVQEWALLRRERSSVQPETTSVTVKVWTYWPWVT